MRIDEINIRNFKGFEDATYRFNPQFNVIIGNNATGKTSILDALSVAAGSYLLGIDPAQARSVKNNEIRIVRYHDDPKPQLPVQIQAKGIVHQEPEIWLREVNKISSKTTLTFKHAKSLIDLAEERLMNSRMGAPVIFPLIAYHGTGRLWAEHKEKTVYSKQKEGVIMGYADCLSPKSSSKNFLSWYKTYENEVQKFGKEQDELLLRTFRQTISSLVPGWEIKHYSHKSGDMVGIFTDPQGIEHFLDYGQLSDGYRNFIGIAADLAYRCIKLNPHLGEDAIKETNGMVLIDEIDLHLYPKWQETIVADLKRVFPKVQFITTTHSPFIVQSLKAEELITLDNISIDNDPFRQSIEEVTSGFMGMEELRRSQRFKNMEAVAAQYYDLIEQGYDSRNNVKMASLRQQLNDMEALYGDDPAFVALLKAERAVKPSLKNEIFDAAEENFLRETDTEYELPAE
jgi:predicted ATP-binding protein involved in virulence